MTLAADDVVHLVLSGGLVVSLCGAAVSFGMLKADNKNVKIDLVAHNLSDEKRFDKMDEKLDSIHETMVDVRLYMAEEKGRKSGIVHTRITDGPA